MGWDGGVGVGVGVGVWVGVGVGVGFQVRVREGVWSGVWFGCVRHREVQGGAAAQVDLAKVAAPATIAVDAGAVVGSVGRGAVDLDLEIDLVSVALAVVEPWEGYGWS